MKRTVRINLNYANKGKLDKLDSVLKEAIRVKNLYIDLLWDKRKQLKNTKYINFKVDTWLSLRMQQCISKQALETIKSQLKKKKQTKPICKFLSIGLDSRFLNIQYDNKNSFDIWIRLTCLGNKIILNIPSKKHKMFLKYQDWKQLNYSRILKIDNKFYIDFIFEKKETEKKTPNNKVGIDIGYKKLITSSTNKIYGKELENIYTKIENKQKGSKAYKRALKERNDKTNQAVNQFIKEEQPDLLIVEDLKNVKYNNKINFNFMKKLQHWLYPKVLQKFERISEETGMSLQKVSPAYTSQRCSVCGAIDKKNRIGETYHCSSCGNLMDADYNASLNILHRGVYGPSDEENKHNNH